MKTYNYWQGSNGTLVICSDGRMANSVFGEAIDGNLIGKDGYESILDGLLDEIFGDKNEADVNPSLVEEGLLHIPDEIIDEFGMTEEAIIYYVGGKRNENELGNREDV